MSSKLDQARRKVSNIGEASRAVSKFPENIGGAQLMAAPNIRGMCPFALPVPTAL